jgi:hypothetical protein
LNIQLISKRTASMPKKSINSASSNMIHVNADLDMSNFLKKVCLACGGFAEPQIMALFQHIRRSSLWCMCNIDIKFAV